MLYEPISYPVFVAKEFDFVTYSGADVFKIGEVFEYEMTNVIHIAWNEARCFKPIPNEDCVYKVLIHLDMDGINIGDIVQFNQLPESRIDDLVVAGFIKKIYQPKNKKPEIKTDKKDKKKTTKKVNKTSYSDISKKLGLKLTDFKKKYSEIFKKEIKDAKHKVTKPTEKKILEALSK